MNGSRTGERLIKLWEIPSLYRRRERDCDRRGDGVAHVMWQWNCERARERTHRHGHAVAHREGKDAPAESEGHMLSWRWDTHVGFLHFRPRGWRWQKYITGCCVQKVSQLHIRISKTAFKRPSELFLYTKYFCLMRMFYIQRSRWKRK